MAKEIIHKLGEDVTRVLAAGAHLASADPELVADKTALQDLARQMGDKAPVVRQLAQMVEKAVVASGRDAARELVSLATSVSQVRAAQTALSPAPDARPLDPAPDLGTPCNARDLYELKGALTERGQGRDKIVGDAIERRDVADLRLVEAVVHAMGDSYLGEKITEQVIPLMGRAVVAPIRARLNLKGGAIDSRRLRALVAVEKAGARELLFAAVRDGSAAVREAALDAIADHVRGVPEFEPLVLDVLRRDKSGSVRRAGVRALAGYGSDAALAALTDAMERETTREAAAEAMGSSTHPKAVERLLGRLDQAPGKGKEEKEKKRARLSAILKALTPHKHPEIAKRALALVEECGATAAKAVLESGDRAQLAKVADLLAGNDDDLFATAVAAAVKLGPDEAFRRLSAVFKAKDREGKAGLARVAAVAAAVGPDADKRWSDLLIRIVADEPGPVAARAIPVLGRLKEPRAVKPLLKLLKSEKSTPLRTEAIGALGEIGDPSALDGILEAAGGGGSWQVTWTVHQAVLALNDPSAVDKVRTIATKQKEGTYHWSRHLLSSLERRFPGR